jgi:hypothetical protein
MPRAISIGLLITSLLLQSLLWMLPAQRTQAADRLSHALVHAMDHGIAQHGHDTDTTLTLDSDHHAPSHSHANEGVQQQGLPVSSASASSQATRAAPTVAATLAPPSAHPDGLLRPPCQTA